MDLLRKKNLFSLIKLLITPKLLVLLFFQIRKLGTLVVFFKISVPNFLKTFRFLFLVTRGKRVENFLR